MTGGTVGAGTAPSTPFLFFAFKVCFLLAIFLFKDYFGLFCCLFKRNVFEVRFLKDRLFCCNYFRHSICSCLSFDIFVFRKFIFNDYNYGFMSTWNMLAFGCKFRVYRLGV